MNACIFCRIIEGDAPGEIVYRDDLVTAFRDIHPVAPVHVLIVPNQHFTSLNDVKSEDEALAGRMILVARKLAVQEGIHKSGYRLIVNTGSHGGQVIPHLHLHLIGGQRMRHPMG